MATQQVLFAETIAGMKKAFKRRAYDSDSDSEIETYSNRGHKLKKRARFAHKGQMLPTEGPSAYKDTVDYAGVRRAILYRNPPLVDEDGYEVDSEDDEERIEEAMASAAELNPYANVRLEHMLAPLTASTDLPSHPTLSKPFTSPNLTNLVEQSRSMMQRENRALWRVRHLWTALCGDQTWVPCETMLGTNDAELYTDDHVARHLMSLTKAPADGDGEPASLANGANKAWKPYHDGSQGTTEDHNEDGDVSMADAGPSHENKNNSSEIDADARPGDSDMKIFGGKNKIENVPRDQGKMGNDQAVTNGNVATQSDTKGAGEARPRLPVASGNGLSQSDETGNNAPSIISENTEQPFVHPMFLAPPGLGGERDLGVPEGEAEDVRRLLAMFVQKQEEVSRGVSKLYNGLAKAHRLRTAVLHWSKAEAHCGVNRDLSDGEDWYDKEEWGLTEDLKKGQDDEEEDTTTTSKKTRGRR